jgi:hypothetical protein
MASMRRRLVRVFVFWALTALIASGARGIAWAGPPYLTDDPEPVEYRHYEIYIGYEAQFQTGDNETSLPFAEINFGPFPNVQISGSLPLSRGVTPNGSYRYGVGDVDFGIKYRFVQETATQPQVSFYPSIGLPTGIHSVSAESDRQTLFLPIWAQKDVGRFTVFGGGGWERNPGAGNRNFWSGGIAGVYNFSDVINAGVELFDSGPSQIGELGTTILGIGMNDNYSAIHSVLWSFGTSIAGQRTTHAYLSYELRLGPAAEKR